MAEEGCAWLMDPGWSRVGGFRSVSARHGGDSGEHRNTSEAGGTHTPPPLHEILHVQDFFVLSATGAYCREMRV